MELLLFFPGFSLVPLGFPAPAGCGWIMTPTSGTLAESIDAAVLATATSMMVLTVSAAAQERCRAPPRKWPGARILVRSSAPVRRKRGISSDFW